MRVRPPSENGCRSGGGPASSGRCGNSGSRAPARRSGDVAQGLFDGALFPFTGMQPHEDILVHGSLHLPTSLVPASHALQYWSFWGETKSRAEARPLLIEFCGTANPGCALL